MLRISKDHIYITEEEEFYRISNLIVSDDVMIDLDKRLHVDGDVFIAGGLNSTVELSAEGSIIINGTVNTRGIQGSVIKMLGRVTIVGDFMSRESAILGATSIEGNLLSFGAITFLSDCRVSEKAALKGIVEANYDFHVKGLLYVDGVLNAKASFSANKLKINGDYCTTYNRHVTSKYTLVMFDNKMSLMVPEIGWKHFRDIEEMKVISEAEDNIVGKTAQLVLNDYTGLKLLMYGVIA